MLVSFADSERIFNVKPILKIYHRCDYSDVFSVSGDVKRDHLSMRKSFLLNKGFSVNKGCTGLNEPFKFNTIERRKTNKQKKTFIHSSI